MISLQQPLLRRETPGRSTHAGCVIEGDIIAIDKCARLISNVTGYLLYHIPGWFITGAYGNDHFLFTSDYFWFCLPLTICLSLAPRYLAKAYNFGFAPDDISTLRYISKMDPNWDFTADSYPTGKKSGLAGMRRQPSIISRTESIGGASSIVDPRRPSYDVRSASRTDMSTGVRSIHRGFDFSTEENGVAMRRMQSNLSERRQSSRNLAPTPENGRKKGSGLSNVFSIRRGLRKMKPGSPHKKTD